MGSGPRDQSMEKKMEMRWKVGLDGLWEYVGLRVWVLELKAKDFRL